MDTVETTTSQPASRRIWKPALAVACLAIVLAAALFFGQGLIFPQVYARLSIDVNPSVEFDLNRQLEVLAVRTLNQEAAQVLAGENLNGLPWQEAVGRWAELLRLRYSQQIQTMLLSAVLPDQASQFAEQLMNMEQTANKGALAGLQIRVIYSKDPAVVQNARQNGLSVGRQMLLTQAQEQHQNYDAAGIADAPLGNLIQNLLQAGQPDQTGMTRKTTQSLSDPSGSASQQTSQQTNQQTNRETNQEQNGQTQSGTSQQTNQETNQEQNGQTQSGTSQQTNQETNQEQNGQTNGSTQGTTNGQTIQSTIHQTDASTRASGR